MPAVEQSKASGKLVVYWGSVATVTIAIKQFYSAATAESLQWMLKPLVMLLESLSDLSFEPTPDATWLDPNHRISIVKSCAGINFFIISLLGYLCQRQGDCRLILFLRALSAAWLTSLAANTLRILLSVYYEDTLSVCLHLSEADSHRLIGITVYFSCLWLQLAGYRIKRFKRAAITASACYFSVTVLIPLLRGWALDLDPVDMQHIVWVTGIPLGMILLGFFFKKLASMIRDYRFLSGR